MADAQVTFSGNASQLLSEYQKLEQARKKEELALKELKGHANAAANEERKLASEAKKLTEQNQTPLEKYNKEVAKLDQLLQKNKISQETYNRELTRQKQLVNETGGAADSVGAKVAGVGRQAAAAFTGVGSVLAGVLVSVGSLKKEWEDLKRRQQESKDTQLGFAGNMRAMAINFAGDNTLSREGLEGRVVQAARKTGATTEAAASAAGVAMSARGHLSAETAMQAVEAGLSLNPADAEGAAQVAGRSLDFMKSGVADNPDAAAQMIVQLQQTARVTDIAKLGKHFAPAINTAMLRGDNAEQASERMVQLNNMMQDQEGATSSTAFSAMVNRLAKFVPTASGKDARGEFGVPQAAIDAFEGSASTEGRIAAMNASPELQRAFLAKNTFEQQAQAPIEQILAGSASAQDALAKARSAITTPTARGFRDFVGGLNDLPSQKLSKTARQAALNKAGFELGDATGGQAGMARQILEDTIGKIDFVGPDFLSRGVISAGFEANSTMFGAPQAALAQVQELQKPGRLPFASDDELQLLRSQEALLKQLVIQSAAPPENALGKQ